MFTLNVRTSRQACVSWSSKPSSPPKQHGGSGPCSAGAMVMLALADEGLEHNVGFPLSSAIGKLQLSSRSASEPGSELAAGRAGLIQSAF
jgi:hypothetical protein